MCGSLAPGKAAAKAPDANRRYRLTNKLTNMCDVTVVDVTVKHPGFARHLFLLSTAASQGMGSYAQMIRIGEES